MTVLNHTKSEGDVTAAKTVKSAERTLRILEILGAAKHPMTVTELFQITGYPRSSLHQLLHTMTQLGWVDLGDDGSTAAVGSGRCSSGPHTWTAIRHCTTAWTRSSGCAAKAATPLTTPGSTVQA